MDKDLVQVYFSNSEVWIVGNRTWNGPYRVSGTPTILSLPIDPTLLGESILAHFSTLKTYRHIPLSDRGRKAQHFFMPILVF